MPGSIKLHKRDAVLLWTMGWARGYLHEFVIGRYHYGEPDPVFDNPPRKRREERPTTLAAAQGSRKSFIYPADEAHDAMLEWCGGTCVPTAFSLEAVNENLRQFEF